MNASPPVSSAKRRSRSISVFWPRAQSDEIELSLHRHARAETPHRVTRRGPRLRGHPRLSWGISASKTWMAGTSPAMTPERWFDMTVPMGWREFDLVVMAAGCSALLIMLLLPMFRRYALARPNARSSHRIPTPQGGGPAVLLALALPLSAVHAPPHSPRPTPLLLLL